MTLFKDFVSGSGAISGPDDTDEFYMRDASGSASKRFTWSALKTKLSTLFVDKTGGSFTGDVSIAKASPILTIDASTGHAKIIVDAATGQAGFYYFYENGVYKGAFFRNSAGRAYYTDDVTGRILDLHTAAGAFDATAMESALMPQPLDGSTEGAARVTAASSTTGQHTINGQVGGDTGLRTIMSWTAGVQDASNQLATIPLGTFTLAGTGFVRLRRQGPWVQLSFPNDASNGITPDTTSPQYLMSTNSLPTGFRMTNSITVPLAYYNQSGAANVSGVGNVANPMIYTEVAESLYRGSAVWYTTDAWPTSLPGVQVNAPFSL